MATIDLGRVTPIYRGTYDAATTYEVNDIVLYDGDLYWHTSGAATTGTAPTDATVWTLAFSGSAVKTLIESYATAAFGSASAASTSATAAAGSASSAAEAAEDAADSAAQTAGIVYTVDEDGTRYAVTKAVVNGYLVETFTEVTTS